MYQLTRITPKGVERKHSPSETLRAVQSAAAYVLMDDVRIPRGEAVRLAADLVGRPPGTLVRHEASGYAFRVDKV